ncbi:MAG: GTP cyclohydrolase I FolE2 [Deltaproteobacteria bacterium]|nr:MAG: GTP cyclohydrolase I FolE2 [Deltaproteobacteria bacterium]
MIDIQKQRDHRNIPINKVGIKNLRYPIRVLDREKGTQSTIANINMSVGLPHDTKGTHMSRFVEMLHVIRTEEVSLKTLSEILFQMKDHLDAVSAHIQVSFPYFIRKEAPVSKSPGLMDYTCIFEGSCDPNGHVDLISEVVVPISSVCPCSKEISAEGAHNQRGEVRLRTRFKHFIWIEDMIRLVENAASCEVYSVLKRTDEKYVTEAAYNNPKFVEDIVRDVAVSIKEDPNIYWFEVSAENFESIHNHSAYAYISSD